MEAAKLKATVCAAGDAARALEGDWIAKPFRNWCRDAGISVSHGYNLAAQGRLKITHLGNRALMTRAESDRVLREGV